MEEYQHLFPQARKEILELVLLSAPEVRRETKDPWIPSIQRLSLPLAPTFKHVDIDLRTNINLTSRRRRQYLRMTAEAVLFVVLLFPNMQNFVEAAESHLEPVRTVIEDRC